MILYHGSVEEVQKPNISFSKNYLDFGRGFYLTTHKKQAEKWAKRKAARKKTSAIVSVFEVKERFENFNTLEFKQENESWIDFVFECRKGSDEYKKYDIIIGGVADDDVFRTLNLYFEGVWTKEKALEEVRYYDVNNQICFVNQEVIEKVLIFKNSYEVKNDR